MINIVNPLIVVLVDGILDFASSGATGTTDNTQPQNSSSGVLREGIPATFLVGNFGDGHPGVTASDFTATTTLTDEKDPSNSPTVSDTIVEESTGNFVVYGSTTFPISSVYGGSTTITGDGYVWSNEPDQEIVYDAPLVMNPVNFTVPADGIYDGPVATFQDVNPYGYLAEYTASVIANNVGAEANSVTIEPGPGSSYTVYADINFYPNPNGYHLPAGNYPISVVIWDTNPEGPNPQGGGWLTDTVAYPDASQPQYSTSVLSQIIQVNGSDPYDPPLAIVTTTDPNITSASQVSVTTGSPPTADSPYPLVTGITLTRLPDGAKQIVVDGVVSVVQPGAGPIASAPLNITLAGEATLTTQIDVDETSSEYVVNPVVVNATADQPVRNIQVATIAGPLNGAYSATINWGGGDTSTGQVTPLGGDLFTVTGSKPHVYTAAGSETITVTVSGPGETGGASSSVTDTALVAPPAGVFSNVSGTGTYAGTGTLTQPSRRAARLWPARPSRSH